MISVDANKKSINIAIDGVSKQRNGSMISTFSYDACDLRLPGSSVPILMSFQNMQMGIRTSGTLTASLFTNILALDDSFTHMNKNCPICLFIAPHSFPPLSL